LAARALGALLALGSAAGGCTEERGSSAEEGSVVHHYTARGRIRALPENEGGKVAIRHEPIPSFRDRNGKEVGMDAMTMPFPPAEGLSLEGLSVGDPVRFRFRVQWAPQPSYRLLQVKKLEPPVELELG
jgi:Cu/Ag efflux protein CusF